MTNIRELSVAQATALEHIIAGLRPSGFDPEGLGLYGANVHIEHHSDGSVDFWLDMDRRLVNGAINTNGVGVVWDRATQEPTTRTIGVAA